MLPVMNMLCLSNIPTGNGSTAREKHCQGLLTFRGVIPLGCQVLAIVRWKIVI